MNINKIACLMICIILLSSVAFADDYVIGDGDSLQISVWGSPDLSLQQIRVRPDGKISLPAMGEIRASGLTPVELKADLEKKLSTLVKKPIVTVIVTEMTNYKVVVFGNGATPGVHSLQRQTSLLQFLSGLGMLADADMKNAYLMRNKKKIKTGFYELFRKGDMDHDVILQPNDILFIPDNFEKRITIVGEVTNPTTLPYREGLTILDVILSAEGFTEFAKKNDVEILRKNENGERTKINIRAKDLMRGDLSKNINIVPGDFVVVKESLF